MDAIDANDRADVHRLLIWLIFKREALFTHDFAQLLSFHFVDGTPVYDSSLLATSVNDMMLLIGTTFITLRDGEVNFAHASVRDYLLSLPPGSPFYVDSHLAHLTMVKTSLAYITSPMAEQLPYLSYDTLSRVPLIVYAWIYCTPMVDSARYPTLEQEIVLALRNNTTIRDIHRTAAFFLGLAADFDQIGLMHLFVDKLDADVNSPIPTGIAPIHRAIEHGHLRATRLLIDKGADLDNKEPRFLLPPLHMAARYCRAAIISLLLASKVDPNCRVIHDFTALHDVALHGGVDSAKVLLDGGAHVNA